MEHRGGRLRKWWRWRGKRSAVAVTLGLASSLCLHKSGDGGIAELEERSCTGEDVRETTMPGKTSSSFSSSDGLSVLAETQFTNQSTSVCTEASSYAVSKEKSLRSEATTMQNGPPDANGSFVRSKLEKKGRKYSVLVENSVGNATRSMCKQTETQTRLLAAMDNHAYSPSITNSRFHSIRQSEPSASALNKMVLGRSSNDVRDKGDVITVKGNKTGFHARSSNCFGEVKNHVQARFILIGLQKRQQKNNVFSNAARQQLNNTSNSSVYRYTDNGFDICVKENKGSDQSQLAMEEMKVLRALHHPNIVRLYETNYFGQHAVVTHFCGGKILKTFHSKYSEEEKLRIVRDILEGLVYIHSGGIIHCDIKPSNIALSEGGIPVILDFGLAVKDGSKTTRRGSVPYISPIAIKGGPFKPSVDAHSFGITLYQLFCSKAEFKKQFDQFAEKDQWQTFFEKVLSGYRPSLEALEKSNAPHFILMWVPKLYAADSEEVRLDQVLKTISDHIMLKKRSMYTCVVV